MQLGQPLRTESILHGLITAIVNKHRDELLASVVKPIDVSFVYVSRLPISPPMGENCGGPDPSQFLDKSFELAVSSHLSERKHT
jgi:hypothetical protein